MAREELAFIEAGVLDSLREFHGEFRLAKKLRRGHVPCNSLNHFEVGRAEVGCDVPAALKRPAVGGFDDGKGSDLFPAGAKVLRQELPDLRIAQRPDPERLGVVSC